MRIRSYIAQVIHAADAVYVIRGITKIKFPNLEFYYPIKKLLKILKQPITESELLTYFDENFHFNLQQIISVLIQNNIIIIVSDTEGTENYTDDEPEAIFYWHFKQTPTEIREKLASIKLAILGINEFSVTLMRSLENAGFKNCSLLFEPNLNMPLDNIKYETIKTPFITPINNDFSSFDCILAVATHNQRNILRVLNKNCLNQKKHFYPIIINNLHAYIGPFVFPGCPACFECASKRFIANIENPSIFQAEQQSEKEITSTFINGYHSCMVDAVASFACIEIINNFTGLIPPLFNKITDICLINQQAVPSKIIKIPGCFCGTQQMLNFHNSKKITLKNLIPDLIDKKFGIIQRVSRVYPELYIQDIHHYYAYTCNTNMFCNQNNIRYSKGVAISKERAILKAIGEGIERYCSAIYDKETLLFSSFKNIKKNALSPEHITLYSNEFYQTHPKYSRFNHDTKIRWAKAINFKTKTEVFVPASMVYLPYHNDPDESKIIQNISTGLACHDSYETAAIRAICEVIERDAFMIFWRKQLSPPLIDFNSLPINIKNILKNYQSRGLDIKLFNITTDINVPAVLALMESNRTDQPPLVMAGACTTSAETTILSALEELELSRQYGAHLKKQKIEISKIDSKIVNTQKDHVLYWHNKKNLIPLEFLKKSKIIIDYNNFSKIDLPIADDLLQILANKVFKAGLDIYLANITSEDIASLGLFVIRAILPNAHPLSFGYGYEQFACARLNSVPIHLGFTVKNSILNKTPHPYP